MGGIAWIDDDIEIIEPVIQPLIEAGHEVARFRSIQSALDSVEVLRAADLILLDMILPPGDLDEDFGYYSGTRLLQKLRAECDVTTPVIVFSVVDPNKVEQEVSSLGVAEYVRKPALPSELERKVNEVLHK